MKCPKCQANVQARDRFCPNCSRKLVDEQDIKSPHEVSREWLKGIFEVQNYKTVDVDLDNSNAFLAHHDELPPIVVGLRPSINIVSIETSFRLGKVGWGKKSSLLAAVNKANSAQILYTFKVNDTMENLYISSIIYLTEHISSRDIVGFIDVFNDGILMVIESSGLKEFFL